MRSLKNTIFRKGEVYEQIEGAAMGSPLSPVIDNIYMENFETIALQKSNLKSKCWFRYVYVEWSHGPRTLNDFLNHLNSIHQNVQFAMEIEEKNTLRFLGVLIVKKEDGSCGHSVYSTHSIIATYTLTLIITQFKSYGVKNFSYKSSPYFRQGTFTARKRLLNLVITTKRVAKKVHFESHSTS